MRHGAKRAPAVTHRLRPYAWIAACAIAFLVITTWPGLLAEHEGLLLPSGPPRLSVLALGAIAIGLRLTLLFVAPTFIGYRLAMRLMRRRSSRPSALEGSRSSRSETG